MRRPLVGFLVALAVLTLLKGAAASFLAPFGDESFYYLCSRHLDWAYADHPFMTAALVRLGVDLCGRHPLGLRAAFLVLGAALPLLVVWTARPLVGRRRAVAAGWLALAAPVLAYGGVVAIPDVPLLLFGQLFLAASLAALASGRTSTWAATGAALALGFATHLRAACFALALGAFLLCHPRGRALLRTPGPWTAAAVSLLGLFPVLAFNVRLDFEPLRYQVAERHHAAGGLPALLEHIPAQAAVVTPLVYVALLATLLHLLRRARRDARAALLSAFALAHLGLFFAASPFADASHATVHWPAPGYLALLPFAPKVLGRFARRSGRRLVTWLVPASGFLCIGLLLFDLATGIPGIRPIHRPFAGWREAARAAGRHLEEVPPGADGRRLLVADDYLLGGALSFFLGDGVDLFLLDHPKHQDHGRQLQFRIWQIDEEGLRRRRAGRDALLAFDADQMGRGFRAFRRRAQGMFSQVRPLEVVSAPGRRPGRPRFYFDLGLGLRGAGTAEDG